jgi:integrase
VGASLLEYAQVEHEEKVLRFQRNVHAKFVQELLGHACAAITLDTYSHMLPGMGGEVVDTMGDALSGDH